MKRKTCSWMGWSRTAGRIFELALMFYEKLNGKTDEFLEEHEYSREEVTDGIKYVVDFYGYGSLMDAFVDENALR